MMLKQNSQDEKKTIVKILMSRNVFLDPASISKLGNLSDERLREIAMTLEELPERDFDAIKKNAPGFLSLFDTLSQEQFYEIKSGLLKEKGLSFYDNYVEEMMSALEKRNDTSDDEKEEKTSVIKKNDDDPIKENDRKRIGGKEIPDDIEVLFHYDDFVKKREMQDFVKHFSNRLEQIGSMLRSRMELSDALPIRRLSSVPPREKLSIIGMVSDIRETKNNSMIIEMQDRTGSITCIASNRKKETYDKARDLTYDEVIGIRGVKGNDSLYIEDIIWPESLHEYNIKKSNSEIGALIISDIQYGNNMFLDKEFNNFISWLNDEKNIVMTKSIRYLFIVGDLVDGIGIYPGQDRELFAKDIRSQFDGLAEYLKRIPKHIRIIAIPGNHDPVRLSEPQPIFPKDYAKSLYEIENFYAFSNPCILRVGKEEGFEGMEFLLYHGYSYDYYAQNIDSIRREGGYNAPLEIMKYLLRRRHLAPSHTSSLYIPDTRKDYMVIERIPDVFVSGHIHRARASQYKTTTLIMSSCWQGMTKFEEKVGHTPEPAKAFHIDFKTRKTTMIDFERADSIHRGVSK